MKIPINEPEKMDVYSLGFDKGLNRNTDSVVSPLVYNSVEERLSLLTQSGDSISSSVTGLPVSIFSP